MSGIKLFVVAALGLILTCSAGAANNLEKRLRGQYKGKVLLLRGFPAGREVNYDAGGALAASTKVGDWTVDGVVKVDKVKISKNHLTINAGRLWVHPSSNSGFERGPNDLRIEASFATEPSDADADALMSRIFLTVQDDFAELVPAYWKPCVRAALTVPPPVEAEPQKRMGCQFSAQFLRIPGVVIHSRNSTRPDRQAVSGTAEPKVEHVGNGVKPPKRISGTEPEFSEEARQAKHQGTNTLGVIIDETGVVRKIWIISPSGYGLDRQAVEAVSLWRFEPARKNEQPVAVEVAVESNFNLY